MTLKHWREKNTKKKTTRNTENRRGEGVSEGGTGGKELRASGEVQPTGMGGVTSAVDRGVGEVFVQWKSNCVEHRRGLRKSSVRF